MLIVDSGKVCIVEASSTKVVFVTLIASLWILAATLSDATAASAQTGSTNLGAQEKTPVATGDKAYPTQLSGIVVDPSGAVIAGATVQIRNENGTVQRT
jgi:hypothetical protein